MILRKSEDIRGSVLVDYYRDLSEKMSKAERAYEAFLRMIEGGYWVPGTKIPSERELTAILPVGLSTIQAALGRLARDGLLQRRRKAGSFITDPAASGRKLVYFPFLGADGETNLTVTDLSLSVFETREQGKWSSFVGPRQTYICVQRLISIGGEFRVHTRLFLGDPKFRALLDIPLSELKDITFRRIFKDRFNAPSLKMERELSFLRLLPAMSEKLDADPGGPAILFEIRQYSLRDEPLFFMESVVPENGRTMKL